MPIANTIVALGCVSPCDTLSELDDSQFFAVLINQLVEATGVSLADITAMDLMEATQAAWCEVGDRVVGDVSPMVLKATALHLLGVVADGAAIDPIATEWEAAALAKGGVVDAEEKSLVSDFYKGLRKAGVLERVLRSNLYVGDFIAAQVPQIQGGGTEVETLNGVTSENYNESEGFSLSAQGSLSIDSGLNANTLPADNVSLFLSRRGVDDPATTKNLAGTDTVWNQLGLIRGNAGRSGGYTFSCAAGNVTHSGAWLFRALGVLSLDSGPNGLRIFKNGHECGRGIASGPGTFDSNTLRFTNPVGNNVCGYLVGRSMTDTEHREVSRLWLELNTALGRTYVDASRRVLCIGDSLTYGYGPSFTQVASHYIDQLAATRGWTAENSDVFQLGVSGQTAEEMAGSTLLSTYTDRHYALSPENVAIVWAGTNDLINNNRSAAQALGYLETICTGLRAAGFRVIVATLFPSTTYAATYTANYNAQVGAVNTALTTESRWTDGTLANAVARIDLATEYQDTTNTTYFQDGLHPTSGVGYAPAAAAISAAYAEAIS